MPSRHSRKFVPIIKAFFVLEGHPLPDDEKYVQPCMREKWQSTNPNPTRIIQEHICYVK